MDRSGVVQVSLGESLRNGVGGLPRAVVRNSAIDVVSDVRRANLGMAPGSGEVGTRKD